MRNMRNIEFLVRNLAYGPRFFDPSVVLKGYSMSIMHVTYYVDQIRLDTSSIQVTNLDI